MDLENMIRMYGSKLEPMLDNAPWWARFVYGNEIKSAKNIITQTEANLKEKNRDANWYLKQGELINEGFSSMYSAVNKTYALLPLYNIAKKIPILNGHVERKVGPVKNMLRGFNINSLPKREEALDLVNKTYDAAISAYCITASMETGLDYEFFSSRLRRDISVKKKDPFDYFINAINSVVNKLGSVFGGSYKTA